MAEQVVGKSLKGLTKEEMNKVYGSQGEMEAQATPTFVISWTISSGIGGFSTSYLITATQCN